ASVQKGATGVGEYRVALATDAASLSNAPSFSVAVTNGALANYGFERYPDASWTNPDGSSGINAGTKINNVYPVAEGTNSYYLRSHTSGNNYPEMRQVVPLEKAEESYTVDVEIGAKVHKRGGTTIVYAQIELAATEDFSEVMWKSPSGNETGANQYRLCTGDDPATTWMDKSLEAKTITVPAGAAYMRFSLFANNAAADIDAVKLGVKKGTGTKGMMRYVANAAAQGLDVKYLFAADADNNRAQDRMVGGTATFYTAFDITPPTPVEFTSHDGASTDSVDDPTTQFDLTWTASNVGPDDPDHENYSSTWTGGTGPRDRLSPWHSYKIYFGTYDPEAWRTASAAGMGGAGTTGRRDGSGGYASAAAYINGEFIDNRAYKAWPSVTKESEIEDPSASGASYGDLGTVGTHSNRLYDLEFDQDYVVVIVGVDKAGNEGPATAMSWATNNTIKFAITQGVVRAKAAIQGALPSDVGETELADKFTGDQKHGAALYWLAAGQKAVVRTNATTAAVTTNVEGRVTKEYDLLYRDAGSFSEKGREPWTAEGTTRTNWNYQTDGLEGVSRRKLRFYRTSYHNRWQDAVTNTVAGQEVVTPQRPLASEDVYSMGRVGRRAGQNLVGLQG
ncbi:MAG: hypothetical protein J6Y19_00220, partial [Kiritimatiellae bacterium]|nr:hypothetical protein [Kiritimatiellia bacterium]